MNRLTKILLPFLFLFSISFSSLIQPENGTSINYTHVLFEWEQEQEAVSYNFQLSSSEIFNSNIVDITDESLIYIDTENLNWESTYYWRIRPIYTDGSYGNWTDTFNFSIEQIRSGAYAIEHNIDSYSDGVTIFSSFFNYFSAAIDKNGNEIWNTGDQDIVYYNTDLYGQLFGCYVNNDIENYLPGIEFSLDSDHIWEEPNDEFLHHELLQLPDGNYMGLVEVAVDGPIPIGPWTSLYQILGYEADGITNEFPWIGDKIVIWDEETKDVIWEWNSFDHFSMQDYDDLSDTWFQGFSNGRYDWTHANAFWPTFDDDGNLESIYLSSRHLSRITKISADSGEIDWNMGLEMPSGDVDFGQNLLFSFQHSLTVLENGNIVTLDNGNLSQVILGTDYPTTRGLEIYVPENEIDEFGQFVGEASIVWEYSLPEQYFGFASGNVQKLNNGNYLIVTVGDGGTALEVTPENEHVWEGKFNLQLPSGAVYRATRVSGLYPVAFSAIIPQMYLEDGYSFIDITNNESIELVLHNEGTSNEEYLIYLNGIYNNSFNMNSNEVISYSVPIQSSDELSITVTPKHRGELTKTINLYLCEGEVCPEVEQCEGIIDECGVCNGDGAIFECGCFDIPSESCDCFDNVNDCLGECGGNASEDCSGECGGGAEIDECGECNGDGSSCSCPEGYAYFSEEQIPNSTIVFDGNTCFNQIDINSLIDLINSNSLTVESPIHLGTQNWSEGRITRLEVGNYFQGGNHTLTTIPSSISNMENLGVLYFNYNQLTQLPDSITELSQLIYLVLSFNNLTSLPDSLGDLTNLVWIDVGYNEIEYLPDSIGNLENLWYLWIFNNNLTYLPDSICNLSINWNSDDYGFLPYFGAGGNQLCNGVPSCVESSSNLNSSIDPLYYSFEITVEQECDEECSIMDINEDGLVNVIDIVNTVNIIFNTIDPTDYQLCAADANADGTINVVDIVTIVNFILSQ